MTLEIDDPELEDILEDAIDAQIALVETGFPAIVVSYNHSKHRAQIAPIVRDRYVDPEDGEVTHALGEVISNVPRAPQCSQAHGITFPLERGDVVWCSVAQRSMDEFLTTGETDTTPAHPRRHDRTDAVIVALLHPFNAPPPSSAVAADKLVVYSENEVLVGDSSAVDYVALASLCASEFTKIATAIAPMATAFNAPVAPMSSLGPGSVVPYTPASVAATKVKAK